MKQHIETQTQWEERMGRKVLSYIADEIVIELPFFEAALHGLEPQNGQGSGTFATDGIILYFPAARYLDIFKSNELFLKRAYLHTILHCIYGHLWLRKNRDRELYNMACDIAVEYIIDGLHLKCTSRPLTWIRQDFYEKMRAEKAFSAGNIYKLLCDMMADCEKIKTMPALAQEFYTDDHRLWWDQDDPNQMAMPKHQEAKKHWQDISDKTQQEKSRSNSAEDSGVNSMMAYVAASKKKRSYRDFLLNFTRLREQPGTDDDEMDLGLYNFGIEMYGNTPIIEALEIREAQTVREFAIAIDTSYSTSGEMVMRFLTETLSILLENNIYNSQTKVHLIQCDDQIRDYQLITDIRSIESIFRRIKVKGGGNTDFRPPFSYLKRLQEEGKAGKIDGLIYFTDGKGIYPKQRPQFKTAFVFVDNYDKSKVPAWALSHEMTME